MRRLEKILLRLLPASDDASIFLVQEHAVAFSNQISILGWGESFMFGSLIASSTALHENMIVACSRLLIVIIPGDLDLKYFRVLRLIASGHSTWHHKLSSRQHAPHPERHVSPGIL